MVESASFQYDHQGMVLLYLFLTAYCLRYGTCFMPMRCCSKKNELQTGGVGGVVFESTNLT